MAVKRFEKEISGSHEIASYVVVTTPTRKTFVLPAVDGSVKVDRSANIRRACTVTCIDPEGELAPRGPESDLTPFGTELRPYRGVVYADGTEEVKPLGVFRISKCVIRDTAAGSVQIQIEAFDLSRTIQRDKFVEPYLIESGTNVIAAIKALVERTFPEIEYDTVSSPITTTAPQLYDVNDDPWESITELALSAGCEAYFDAEGRFVVVPETGTMSSPVYTYIEGKNCTVIDLEVEFTDDPGYNGVVVEAESTGDEKPPIRVVVWDDDPMSPTYHRGPYGEVPMHHTERLAKTTEEAEAVGRQIVKTLLGFAARLSLTAMVNPALEGGNIVQVERARSHVSGLFSVESFSVPFGARGAQSIELKQQQRRT